MGMETAVTWNYRLVHRRIKTTPGTTEHTYAIHEVYYDDDGVPDMVTEGEVGVLGETIEEAKSAWTMMEEAFNQPVLEYDDIGRSHDEQD